LIIRSGFALKQARIVFSPRSSRGAFFLEFSEMSHWPVHGTITGPIVMIGFGSIGRGTLPLRATAARRSPASRWPRRGAQP
jgi:hypothetical protein